MSLGYAGVFGGPVGFLRSHGCPLGSTGTPGVLEVPGVHRITGALGSQGVNGVPGVPGILGSLWSLGSLGVPGVPEVSRVQAQHILNHKSQHQIPSVTWRRVLRTPLPLPEGAPQVDRGGFREHLGDIRDILEGSLMFPDDQCQIS